MTLRKRRWATALGVFTCAVLGWNAFVWYEECLLAQDARLFQATCRGAAGCPLALGGWHAGAEGVFYSGLYEYTATKARFELRKHLATDLWLVAEGGKDGPARIHRIVE